MNRHFAWPICGISLILLTGCGSNDVASARSNPQPPPSPPSGPAAITIPPDSRKLEQIRVEPAGMQDIAVDEIVAPGKIEIDPHRVSRVMLPVTGRVVATPVHIGDFVTQGQTVLLLESSDADSALAAELQTTAGIFQAKAAYNKAKADYERLKDLFEAEAVAKKDVIAAEAALAQAQSALDQAEAVDRQAKARLELLGLKPNQLRQKIEIHAPISGKVLEMNAVAGEFRNDPNAPVMTIGDLSTVWITSDVPEDRIRMIKIAEHLQVELTAFPDRLLQARVTRIADMVDPATRTIKVYAELVNPKGDLRPEMFGRVRHVNQTRRLVAVPAGAIVQAEGKSYVFREISRGTFEQAAVETSGRAAESVGILSGLKAGDRIVVDGAMLLKQN
jgi:cobalt-zinc-cadmium efflux system membrane fusion protein